MEKNIKASLEKKILPFAHIIQCATYKNIFILNYKNTDVYRMGKPIITRNWFASQICFVYRYLRD